jgi:hypothetical protein
MGQVKRRRPDRNLKYMLRTAPRQRLLTKAKPARPSLSRALQTLAWAALLLAGGIYAAGWLAVEFWRIWGRWRGIT